MRSVQEKFFSLLEERAEKEDMEVVLHKEWSNVGTINLQEKDGFETWLSIYFSFDKIAYFGQRGTGGPRIFEGRPNPCWAGFEAHELDKAIDYLINYAITCRDEAVRQEQMLVNKEEA